MAGNKEKGNVFFRRIRGRIVPIVRKENKAAKELASQKNWRSWGIFAAGGVGSMAGMYGAGKLHRLSNALMKLKQVKKSDAINRLAKIGKFSAHGAGGLAGGYAIASIDKRTKSDEGSFFLDMGKQPTKMINMAAQGVLAYGVFRVGKRFEKAGKLGLSLFKKSTYKKIKHLRDI